MDGTNTHKRQYRPGDYSVGDTRWQECYVHDGSVPDNCGCVAMLLVSAVVLLAQIGLVALTTFVMVRLLN